MKIIVKSHKRNGRVVKSHARKFSNKNAPDVKNPNYYKKVSRIAKELEDDEVGVHPADMGKKGSYKKAYTSMAKRYLKKKSC